MDVKEELAKKAGKSKAGEGKKVTLTQSMSIADLI